DRRRDHRAVGERDIIVGRRGLWNEKKSSDEEEASEESAERTVSWNHGRFSLGTSEAASWGRASRAPHDHRDRADDAKAGRDAQHREIQGEPEGALATCEGVAEVEHERHEGER